jgi:hypothetical protein
VDRRMAGTQRESGNVVGKHLGEDQQQEQVAAG